MTDIDSYRIGWAADLRRIYGAARLHQWRDAWRALRYRIHRWRPTRPWQAEISDASCTCNGQRAWTETGARLKAYRAHQQEARRG